MEELNSFPSHLSDDTDFVEETSSKPMGAGKWQSLYRKQKSELEDLRAQLNELKRRHTELRKIAEIQLHSDSEIENLRDENKNLIDGLKEKDEAIKRLSATIKKQREHNEKFAQLKKQTEDSLAAVQNELAIAVTKFESAERQAHNLTIEQELAEQKHQALYSQLKTQSDQQMTEIGVLRAQLDQQKKDQLNTHTQSAHFKQLWAGQAQKQQAAFQAQMKELEVIIAKQRDEIRVKDQFLEKSVQAQNDSGAIIRQLQSDRHQLKHLVTKLRAEASHVEGVRRQLTEKDQEVKAVQQRVQALTLSVQGLEQSKSELESRIQAQVLELKNSRDREQRMTLVLDGIRQEFSQERRELKADLYACKQIHREMEQEAMNLKSQLHEVRSQAEQSGRRWQTEKETLVERHSHREKELMQTQQNRQQDLENQIASFQNQLKAALAEMEARRSQWLEEKNALSQHAVSLEQELKATTAEFTETRQRYQRDLDSQCERFAQVETQLAQQLRKTDSAETECRQLRERLETQSKQMKEENARVTELIQKISMREQFLTGYVDSVEKQRREIVRCVTALAGEIESAQALHPLNDYLNLTEFELQKIEAQLKMTPTVSSERPQLEACFVKLLEQRNFLTTAIQQSLHQAQAKAAHIRGLMNSQDLMQIPPLPPPTSGA
jgi:chromosome segregation ATPase